jgi:hypothetical protein
MTVPGLREANRIMADLKRLGIHDVELMFDKEVILWAAVQVFKPSGKILLMNDPKHYDTQPYILFWIRNDDMTYREPSDQDLSDIIAIVKRAQVWFDKGSDYMVDQIEAEEQYEYTKKREKQSEKIRSYAKPMKKAIKKELL